MTSNVSKSFEGRADPVISYCTKLTVKQSAAEKELQESTLANHDNSGMLGAAEVLQFGKNFIQLINAKRCLDIGTYTGASALAWATVLPEDGKVMSFDVDHSALNRIGMPILERNPHLKKKIVFQLGPALEKLNELINNGESGQWDFAFIDADKTNYTEYYKLVMRLLRPGGVVFVDNSLWNGQVTQDPKSFSATTKAIYECNEYISNDPSSNSALINLGDGTHIAFKI